MIFECSAVLYQNHNHFDTVQMIAQETIKLFTITFNKQDRLISDHMIAIETMFWFIYLRPANYGFVYQILLPVTFT